MNTVNKIETGENAHPATGVISAKINMRKMKLKIIICPATMLAKRRIIKAPGLINNTPANSTGTRISLTKKGTPGGQNICCQKCDVVLNKITIKAMTPKTAVKAILPVTFADPGIIATIVLNKIKKNTVSKKGMYFSQRAPKLTFATSSRTNKITGSMSP